MADAVGPVYAGRFEEFVIQENGEQYTLMFLADRNNDALQREGKPPAYYWIPGQVRLARRGDTGDYKFRHIHFVGVMDGDQVVGGDNTEVTGGVLSLTTTSRYPTSVLKQATDQLLEKFRGDDDRYWGWRTSAAPMIAMAPITSNVTAITNLAPGRDGTAPAENLNRPAGGPPDPNRLVRRAHLNGQIVRHGMRQERSNVDAWAFGLEGAGPGSVTGGENAYSGIVGAYPSELIWVGFHGGYSPIAVAQHLIMPMWSQELYLKITGKWDRIFDHFSAAAGGSYLWFSADVQAEFNKLRISGGIKVELAIDGTMPGGDEMERAIQARIDVISQQFMQQAAQVIFQPAPQVQAAQRPSGGLFSSIFGGGGGLALKKRRDTTNLDLSYEETRYFRYNQPNTISSTLDGLRAEVDGNPEAEKKYFQRIELGSLSRKVTRIVKPVCNWSPPDRSWVGDPVSFVSAQIGYPTADGSPAWTARVFQSTDTDAETTWRPAFVRRMDGEIASPPAGWEPDKTYVKRKVHLQEPPGAFENPHVRLRIEQNEVDLDPGEHGTLTSDKVLEVRADSVGALEIGPVNLNVRLQDDTQWVEVSFKPNGTRLDGSSRADDIERFSWKFDDQDEPRFFKIYTGDLNYEPDYEYKVRVIVRGSIFSAGMEWEGPWVAGQGNGPLMVRVPTQDQAVDRTVRTPRELIGSAPIAALPAASVPVAASPAVVGAPPGTMRGAPIRTPESVTASARTVGGLPLQDPRPTTGPRTDRRPARSAPQTASSDRTLELVSDGWSTSQD